MSIQELYTNIKHTLGSSDRAIIVVIIITSALSFSLGKYSAGETVPVSILQATSQDSPVMHTLPKSTVDTTESAAVRTEPTPTQSTQTAAATVTEGGYVAAKSGTKYHLPWCSGAQRIKEENKIWFKTKAEAEAAGYTPAANCKGI
jgi:hypothetical protein